jgi:hypothetical protein
MFAWTVRLVYLAIHQQQHPSALQEALERMQHATEQCLPAYERIAKNVSFTVSPSVVVRDQGRYCWCVYCRGAHKL